MSETATPAQINDNTCVTLFVSNLSPMYLQSVISTAYKTPDRIINKSPVTMCPKLKLFCIKSFPTGITIIPTMIIVNGMDSLMCSFSLNTSIAITKAKIISLLLKIDALTAVDVDIP